MKYNIRTERGYRLIKVLIAILSLIILYKLNLKMFIFMFDINDIGFFDKFFSIVYGILIFYMVLVIIKLISSLINYIINNNLNTIKYEDVLLYLKKLDKKINKYWINK